MTDDQYDAEALTLNAPATGRRRRQDRPGRAPNEHLEKFAGNEHVFARNVMLVKYTSIFVVMPGKAWRHWYLMAALDEFRGQEQYREIRPRPLQCD